MTVRGFTLVEVLVVIALIGILTGLATFGFSQYTTKSSIENQTRLLYGNMMEYRVKAMYEKKNWTLKMAAAGYGIYSSAETTVNPVFTVTFKYPVTFNTTNIQFDSYGLVSGIGTVCVTGQNSAAVDSVVVSMTRVQIGKKKEGESCAATNIDAR